ncbi:exonuclease V [Pisolithus marmoratus]|nr:exonuclease V [Pisolithus marmoratus]
MSSDEYDEYDLSEFTSQELAVVDANVSDMLRSIPEPTVSSAGPKIHIALESSCDRIEPSPAQQSNVVTASTTTSSTLLFVSPAADSPYSRFCSWRKAFSVTDLVSPAWCELQYEYGFFAQKHKPLHLRPSSFISRSGKQVHVQRDRATTSDRRLRRGKSTHQALENELRPVTVTVTTNTPEERFGLRVAQLITGFNEVIASGKTRELPVFGIIHGHAVVGVIDEVVQVFTASESPIRRDGGVKSPSADGDSGTHTRLSGTSSQGTYTLGLVDYKTRRAEYLPPEEDSRSPKLQLMLYYRMLASLLTPGTVDFDLLWSLMDLDPNKRFSDKFVRDVGWADAMSDGELHLDLNSMVSEWVAIAHREIIEEGRLKGVNAELQLIYRRALDQIESPDKRNQRKEYMELNDPLQALALEEQMVIARAIAGKLPECGVEGEGASDIANAIAEKIQLPYPPEHYPSAWSQLVSAGSDQENIALQWAIQDSLLSSAEKARTKWYLSQNEPIVKGDGPSNAPHQGQESDMSNISRMSPIIGARKFLMNDAQLDSHLDDILQWWMGSRKPRGVTVAHTYRCFTCEYQKSCEWREEKAKEAAASVLERRQLAESL